PEMLKGDEIQMVLRPEASALRLALYLRGQLAVNTSRNVTIRIGMGTGGIDRLSRNGPFQSDGPAFHNARAAVDRVRKAGGSRSTALRTGEAFLDGVADPVLGLQDAITTRWTLPQWSAVLERIKGKELRLIAGPANVSVQSISKVLRAASWNEVRDSIDLL